MRFYVTQKNATSLFFLLVFHSLIRSVCYSSWLEPFANVVPKDIFAYELHRFLGQIFLLLLYSSFESNTDFFFFARLYVSLFIVRKKQSKSQCLQTYDTAKRVCNNLKIYISYGPNGRFTHILKKKKNRERRNASSQHSFLWFYHSSPVVNHKANLVNMYEVEKKRWILFFFSVCPLWKLQ